jgi:DNA end-binding protein Ku
LIRPYGDAGLIFHQLYYTSEVRAFDEIDTGATFKFSATEQDLAEKLIEQLSADDFEADKYADTYRDRVQAAVDQKVAGQEITVAPEEPKAQIIDLFEALKKSISATKEKATPKPPKKAESAKTEAAVGKRSRAKKSAG